MDWTRGRIIGRGSSATVSVARDRSSGRLIAVKSVDLSKSECLEREALILSKVNCPHIISYEGCGVTNENGVLMYNLCMEFASRGTISDAIRFNCGRLDEAVIRSYTKEVLDGLAYLHSNGVVHCDIKGSNVLITDDGVVKIGDLGCAKSVDDDDDQAPVSGTPLFMAPEVARGEHQGSPADIWALGCTVIEMATGNAPWITGLSDPLSTLYRIGYSGEVPEVPHFMSKQAKDFLSKCFERDPDKRWTASELLDHDFLKKSGLKSPNDVPGSNSFTPTSVLDQKLWESQDDQKLTTQNPTQMDCSDNSPAVRIQQLSKPTSTSCSAQPVNEYWVTVRGVEMSSQDHKSLTRISIGSSDNSSSTSCKHSCRTLLDLKHCNVGNDLCVKHDIEMNIGKQSFFLFSFLYRTPLYSLMVKTTVCLYGGTYRSALCVFHMRNG